MCVPEVGRCDMGPSGEAPPGRRKRVDAKRRGKGPSREIGQLGAPVKLSRRWRGRAKTGRRGVNMRESNRPATHRLLWSVSTVGCASGGREDAWHKLSRRDGKREVRSSQGGP